MQLQSGTKRKTIRLYGDSMILKLINHSEEYAVREITASFFPKEKFVVTCNEIGEKYTPVYLEANSLQGSIISSFITQRHLRANTLKCISYLHEVAYVTSWGYKYRFYQWAFSTFRRAVKSI